MIAVKIVGGMVALWLLWALVAVVFGNRVVTWDLDDKG